MINLAFDDIRDKLDKHITGLITDFPDKDVIGQLTADQLKQLWDTEKQRILALIAKLENFAQTLEVNAQGQINQQIQLDFASKPKGSFGLYMDKG